MERLYVLNRKKLMVVASSLVGVAEPGMWDPYTDQQLRDLITNKLVFTCLTDLEAGGVI